MKQENNRTMETKIVLITGGTSGLGLIVARRFISEGYRVILASVDSDEIVQKALDSLKDVGTADFIRLNITEHQRCKDVVAAIEKKYGRIDILINAAGVRGNVTEPTKTDFDDFELTMRINCTGNIMIATVVAECMKRHRTGIIINITSISGETVSNIDLGYHCSKAAMAMATKVLAKEVGPYGVRCLAVAPGGVQTGMMNLSGWEAEGKKLHIRKRLLSQEEVAGIIYLLTTEDASAINGSIVMADDGYCSFKGVF